MRQEEIRRILDLHRRWLCEGQEGGKANLQWADLQRANLQWADLQWANLQWANFQWANLQGANLQGAVLRGADLQWANLQGANLQGANLQRANLRGADLREADLRGADLDFSSGIPFHCGGTKVVGDSRLFSQMMYRLVNQNWKACSEEERVWLESIPFEIATGFKNYRNDI